MLIELDGTNNRLVTWGDDDVDGIRVVFVDTQLVHRVSTWFYGPQSGGPPKRLPENEREALIGLAKLNALSLQRRRQPLFVDFTLACLETSRRQGRFDELAYRRRFDALETVLHDWTGSLERMVRQVSRQRGFHPGPADVEQSGMDGDQLYVSLLASLLDAIELRSVIVAGQRVSGRIDDQLGLLDTYVTQSIRWSGGPPWGGIALAIDGIFNPVQTTFVAESLVKPHHTDWNTAHGILAKASNVSFDLMMADSVRLENSGRSLSDARVRRRPRSAALLTQDKALPRLMSLFSPRASTYTGTWDAVDVGLLVRRLNANAKRRLGLLLRERSTELERRKPGAGELRVELEARLRSLASATDGHSLEELMTLVEERFAESR